MANQKTHTGDPVCLREGGCGEAWCVDRCQGNERMLARDAERPVIHVAWGQVPKGMGELRYDGKESFGTASENIH